MPSKTDDVQDEILVCRHWHSQRTGRGFLSPAGSRTVA